MSRQATSSNLPSIFRRLSLDCQSMKFLLLLMFLCHNGPSINSFVSGLVTPEINVRQSHRNFKDDSCSPSFWSSTDAFQSSQRHPREWISMLFLNPSDDLFEEDLLFGDPGVSLPDLEWRVQKFRLEEENKKRFLKSRPRFLPYEDATKWVQAWGQRWTSEEDWWVLFR